MYKISEVSWDEFLVAFVRARSEDPHLADMTSPPEELVAEVDRGTRLFLAYRSNLFLTRAVCAVGGFALSRGGELMAVHVRRRYRGKGIGLRLVQHAVRRGARTLNCFEGGLEYLYGTFGFVQVRRRKNVDGCGPDVIFMERETWNE